MRGAKRSFSSAFFGTIFNGPAVWPCSPSSARASATGQTAQNATATSAACFRSIAFITPPFPCNRLHMCSKVALTHNRLLIRIFIPTFMVSGQSHANVSIMCNASDCMCQAADWCFFRFFKGPAAGAKRAQNGHFPAGSGSGGAMERSRRPSARCVQRVAGATGRT